MSNLSILTASLLKRLSFLLLAGYIWPRFYEIELIEESSHFPSHSLSSYTETSLLSGHLICLGKSLDLVQNPPAPTLSGSHLKSRMTPSSLLPLFGLSPDFCQLELN